jgi:hypothetical protein
MVLATYGTNSPKGSLVSQQRDPKMKKTPFPSTYVDITTSND